ncbi:MAG: YicC family protein [Ignavibacteriae bacterium]|nr:YicC family protein [Ignavibacteria bacterium]MBI3364411.1 YicC family protein [Ignavibacteriota bacterium]
MISSMTGYGRGEVSEDHTTVAAEVRTVNSRYLEVSTRLPRTIALRENDVKELVRTKFARGKINIAITIEHENTNEIPLKINASAAKAYHKLLETLRKEVNIDEKITLDHLLKFPEVLEIDEFESGDEREWSLVHRTLVKALDETAGMRRREGSELMKDLVERVNVISTTIDGIELMAKERIPQERTRLEERLLELLADKSIIDQHRLELELALYADKLDVTEECVRFRSHNKFFLEALKNEEAAGRKLNFLVQEMNREANTIGAKANSAGIAHLVVGIKEELEKIREQLQNIE